jgi:hypothetical protein
MSQLQNVEHYLTIYESPYTKCRLGSLNDGGYVTCELPGTYDRFISCGIGTDLNFENEFLNKYKNVPCTAFDGTISQIPHTEHAIQYVAHNVYAHTLDEYIHPYSNAFVKMDIEGHEFGVLPALDLSKVKQLVVEIHTPNDIQLHPSYFTGLVVTNEDMENMLRYIQNTHTLVHLHGNNGCGMHLNKGVLLPDVFECTFIRNEFILNKNKNTEDVPTVYDSPNCADRCDISLCYVPFKN